MLGAYTFPLHQPLTPRALAHQTPQPRFTVVSAPGLCTWSALPEVQAAFEAKGLTVGAYDETAKRVSTTSGHSYQFDPVRREYRYIGLAP